mmetsp:Transcript_38987/g.83495  ORF Transcript_38987/g.83495 Transcript_38987/m.83495 type:complete len:223 (+) Transcript_38987:22-690(+)
MPQSLQFIQMGSHFIFFPLFVEIFCITNLGSLWIEEGLGGLSLAEGVEARDELLAESVDARVDEGILCLCRGAEKGRGGDGAQVVVLEHSERVDQPALLEEEPAAPVVLLEPEVHVDGVLRQMRVVRLAQSLKLGRQLARVLEKMAGKVLGEDLEMFHGKKHVDHQRKVARGQLQVEGDAAQVKGFHRAEEKVQFHGLVLEERLEDLLVQLLELQGPAVDEV